MTPEKIVESRIRNIVERPRMFVCSFSELEAVLHALVGVLQCIRGLEDREDDPDLRALSSGMFGGRFTMSASEKIRLAYGADAWNTEHFYECVDLYRMWTDQFLISHPSVSVDTSNVIAMHKRD